MTDPRGREPVAQGRQRQHLDEFLADATRDVERMRALIVQLEAGDPAAWARVQNTAHNLGARSRTLKLDVMNACARELEQLTDERQDGVALDGFFLQCVTGAIETLALEIAALRRA